MLVIILFETQKCEFCRKTGIQLVILSIYLIEKDSDNNGFILVLNPIIYDIYIWNIVCVLRFFLSLWFKFFW